MTIYLSTIPITGSDFYLITIKWSVKGDIVNPFGSKDVPLGETLLWEGERNKKKDDSMTSSKMGHFKILPDKVSVRDEIAK